MPENITWNNSNGLEAEIAELSRQIEVKRQQLESERGIVSDREVVQEALADNFNVNEAVTTTEQVGLDMSVTKPTPQVAQAPVVGQSYLDTLDDQSVTIINNLISLVPVEGIKKTIKQALAHPPFILDAFHDALVDKLYDELKTRGLVS